MRPSVALLAVVSLLGLALAPATAAIPAPGAAQTRSSPNVESAWEASFGPGIGDVLVRAFDTGEGLISLSLHRLDPSTDYAAALYGAPCPAHGSRVIALGTLTSSSKGKVRHGSSTAKPSDRSLRQTRIARPWASIRARSRDPGSGA